MSQVGKVKSWSDEKGFGFIFAADGGNDVFVHRKVIGMQSSLIPDKEVRYDVQMENGKPKATSVSGEGVVKRAIPSSNMGFAKPSLGLPGIVKSWNQQKGYGFISQGTEGQGQDIFVLNTQTRGNLVPGRSVTFTIGTNPKTNNPWAENVIESGGGYPAYDHHAGFYPPGPWAPGASSYPLSSPFNPVNPY